MSGRTGDAIAAECVRAFRLLKAGKAQEAGEIVTLLGAEGYAPAQVLLGWLYQAGEGRPVDAEQARHWYQVAADNGYSVGQHYLGVLNLQEGRLTEGASWIQKAAAQGYAPALYRLGTLYQSGSGVVADKDDAHSCLERAAALGHPFAQREIALELIKGHAGIYGVVRGLWWYLCTPILAYRFLKNHPDSEMLYP